MESHISPFIYESPVRLSCICNTQPHTLTPHTYKSHTLTPHTWTEERKENPITQIYQGLNGINPSEIAQQLKEYLLPLQRTQI